MWYTIGMRTNSDRKSGFRAFYGWGKSVVFAFFDNNCSMHAAGLTYFALLAVIPVMCCVLVAAKVCHVDHYARLAINTKIDALITNVEKGQEELGSLGGLGGLGGSGEEELEKKRIAAEEFASMARDVSNKLFERIERFDVGTLGWVGFGFLLWTVISSLGMVEVSFNQIWGVARPRPIWKRAYTYLFIMVALPVLATVAMSLPIMNVVKNVIVATLGATWLTKWAGDGLIWFLESTMFRLALTLLFASVFFGFFFWMMPNCRVRVRDAWWGGLITAFFFGAWVKVCAIAQIGIAKSSALYGSFAFLPIVLAWLYMSWQIVLLGAIIVHSFDKKDLR